jgi:hypothetical protein
MWLPGHTPWSKRCFHVLVVGESVFPWTGPSKPYFLLVFPPTKLSRVLSSFICFLNKASPRFV